MHSQPTSTHWNTMYSSGQKSAWTSNPMIAEEINVRMTTKNKHWLNWVFEDYFGRSFDKLLSIGCGDGAHELIIGRNKYANYIKAFDMSQVGITNAQSAADKESLQIDFEINTFDEFASSPDREQYDVVLFAGSLHHVLNIQEMLVKVQRILAPSGVVIINEYVGPCYCIYPDTQVRIINNHLNRMAPIFKLDMNSKWKNPSIELAIEIDPSEAVRSSLIPSFMEFYFDPVLKREFGGALLHPIFDHLNSAKLNDGSAESNTIVNLLIEAEANEQKTGNLDNNFLFGIYETKKSPR